MPDLPTLEHVARIHILAVLQVCAGNCTHAAVILGVDRKTLYRRLQRWGVRVKM